MSSSRATFLMAALSIATVVSAAEPAKLTLSTPPLDREAAAKLPNPVPEGSEAIAAGKRTYAQFCVQCHGEDGKAQFQIVANATDLTNPEVYKSGTSPGSIFRSIRDGAGLAMPAFKGQIKSETQIWELTHFIQSLWPDEAKATANSGEAK